MLCEKCQERPATIHYRKIINGEKVEQHLCEVCGKSQQAQYMNLGLDFPNMLAQFFDLQSVANPKGNGTMNYQQIICPKCNTSIGEFRKIGKVGCDQCYTTFQQSLEGIAKKIQGNAAHGGKIPQRAGAELKQKRRISDLQNQLKEALQKEAYEEAAKLRDELKQIQGGSYS